jgi:O-antigen/teichoic acid export membrane protein
MLHPLFSVLVNRPELIADHVAGYAGLVREEATGVGTELLQRAIALAFAVACAAVFLALAGVAVMLGVLNQQFHWSLVAMPGAALVLALIGTSIARRPLSRERFSGIREQFNADLTLLRAAADAA